MLNQIRLGVIVFLLLCLGGIGIAVSDNTSHAKITADSVFAKVGEQEISVEEFLVFLRQAMRNQFYHGKIPENEAAAFRRKTADLLVERELLAQAAKRQGLKVDLKSIEEKMLTIEKQNAQRKEWAQIKNDVLREAKKKYEYDQLIGQLEKRIKIVDDAALGNDLLKKYYEKNQKQFTTPEQIRVGLILLKVDPSSGAVAWNAAREEAQRLVEKLKKGADFNRLAQIHSADGSAKNGGDMGFLHDGMLAAAVHTELAKLKPGEISQSMTLLQGIAIFKLHERKSPQLNAFDAVKSRVRELWIREQQQKQWTEYKTSLRARTQVQLNESLL